MHWKDNCHLSLDNYGLFISSETGHPKSPSVVQELSDFPVSPSGKSQQEESCITPLCNWLSGIYIILTRIYGKYVRSLFPFFKHTCTNDICWVYNTRTGEATYWPGKFKNSPGSGEAKFSPDEGEKSTKSGFTGSVTEGCFIDAWNKKLFHIFLVFVRKTPRDSHPIVVTRSGNVSLIFALYEAQLVFVLTYLNGKQCTTVWTGLEKPASKSWLLHPSLLGT